jgi:hypothetical protein
MLRDVNMNEISDGKLYGSNDLVKADCQDCQGCSDCCRGMGNSIVLDPLDLHRLSVGLSKAPEKLLEREVGLDIFDGNILPHLKMEGASESCLFLDGNGRCSIHPFRPGICRLFPLGRYYENGSYQYFLQVNECTKTNRSKIKVKKWLDTPQLKQYEAYINDWHYFLKDVQEILYNSEDSEQIRTLNLSILQNFYLTPYDSEQDFYEQFDARLAAAKAKLN